MEKDMSIYMPTNSIQLFNCSIKLSTIDDKNKKPEIFFLALSVYKILNLVKMSHCCLPLLRLHLRN